MKTVENKAFTLAEILITIGIVGIVAALTIPTLIQNSNSKKFVTQYKKSLSTLNQAAISAQAQYDMDYSNLIKINEDSTCKSDTLSGGQYSLCGLFNNTLSAQTYIGQYGNVKGINDTTPYNATVTSFSISNFLFFSFADGAFVAFNPNAKDCGVGAGNIITTEMLTNGKLANCLGFIDVNGPNPPNNEVSCADETTTISTNITCKVTNGSMGDIFPIVFHDGMIEPATNASLSAFLGGNGKEEAAPQSKYDLSTPEGRKRADVDNMENIADAFDKAFKDGKLEFEKNFIQFTVYGDGEGNVRATKTFIDSYWSQTGERMDRQREKINQIIKDSGIDFDNIKVNSTDDKWKYGYTININKEGVVEIWARNKNDSPSDYNYWYRQNVITEEERK